MEKRGGWPCEVLYRDKVLGAKQNWPQKRGGCPCEVVADRGNTVY